MHPPVETRRFHPYSRDYVGVPADPRRKREIFGRGCGSCSFPRKGRSPVVVLQWKLDDAAKRCLLEEDCGTSVKWVFPPNRMHQGVLYRLIDREATVRVLVRLEAEHWQDRGEYYVTGMDTVLHPDPVDVKGNLRENRRFVLQKKEEEEEFIWKFHETITEDGVLLDTTSPLCLREEEGWDGMGRK